MSNWYISFFSVTIFISRLIFVLSFLHFASHVIWFVILALIIFLQRNIDVQIVISILIVLLCTVLY